MKLRGAKWTGLTLACAAALATADGPPGTFYTYTGDYVANPALWPHELNWARPCQNPEPLLCTSQGVVDGYPDDPTDDARIIEVQTATDTPPLPIELSTETIDGLVIHVALPGPGEGDGFLGVSFTSVDTVNGNTLTCDHVRLFGTGGPLTLSVTGNAEFKTTD